MTEAKIYEVATQPNIMASIWSSLPIEGRAMLMEEPIKVARKKLNEATAKAVLLFTGLPILTPRLGSPFIVTQI